MDKSLRIRFKCATSQTETLNIFCSSLSLSLSLFLYLFACSSFCHGDSLNKENECTRETKSATQTQNFLFKIFQLRKKIICNLNNSYCLASQQHCNDSICLFVVHFYNKLKYEKQLLGKTCPDSLLVRCSMKFFFNWQSFVQTSFIFLHASN